MEYCVGLGKAINHFYWPGRGLNPGLPNGTPALYPLLHELTLDTFFVSVLRGRRKKIEFFLFPRRPRIDLDWPRKRAFRFLFFITARPASVNKVKDGTSRGHCCKNNLRRGCQMVYFKTKNSNLGRFWRALECKMLVYFTAVWYNL
jgi:hypothetical protein